MFATQMNRRTNSKRNQSAYEVTTRTWKEKGVTTVSTRYGKARSQNQRTVLRCSHCLWEVKEWELNKEFSFPF